MINQTPTTKLTTHTTHHYKTQRCKIIASGGVLHQPGKLDVKWLSPPPPDPTPHPPSTPKANQAKEIGKEWKVVYRNYPWGARPAKCPHCGEHGIMRNRESFALWCYTCGFRA